jgi:hypothetical protein
MTVSMDPIEAIVYCMTVVAGKIPAPESVTNDALTVVKNIARGSSRYSLEDFRRASWLVAATLYSAGGIDAVEDYLDIVEDPDVELEYDFMLFCIVTRDDEISRRYDVSNVEYERNTVM